LKFDHGEDVWVSWSAVADAGYWVCWDTSNNNTCDTGWYPNGASTTKLLEDLSAGTYYWQIKVDPDAGADYETNGGEWWAFTVGSGSPPGSGTSTVTREYVYLGSKLLASIESGTTTTWYHVDVLGSVRAITSSAGATLTRHDYAPFGESNSSLTGDPRRFLGEELDAETALDHFGARQYRNVWGRFTGIDPIFSASARTNPQLWNRYAYALNGPLRYTNATGLTAGDLMVESYGVTGCDPAAFMTWVEGSYADRMQSAFDDAVARFGRGEISAEELVRFLPAGLRKAIDDAIRQSRDNNGRETGFDMAFVGDGVRVFPYQLGTAEENEALYDMTRISPADLVGVRRLALSVHVHGVKSKPGASQWDRAMDPEMKDDQRRQRELAIRDRDLNIAVDANNGRVYFYGIRTELGNVALGDIRR
jgi:RHS repeat-associated protein